MNGSGEFWKFVCLGWKIEGFEVEKDNESKVINGKKGSVGEKRENGRWRENGEGVGRKIPERSS